MGGEQELSSKDCHSEQKDMKSYPKRSDPRHEFQSLVQGPLPFSWDRAENWRGPSYMIESH